MQTEPRIGRGGVSRHLALLKNADVDRWNRNLKAGSEKTAKVWLAAVGRFMEWAGLTPEGLLSKTGDEATRLLEDYRDAFQDKSSGTELVILAVRSLLQGKGIALTQKIKVKTVPRVHEQHIPTQAELRAVLGAANLRARAAISIMAFSGTRIEVLGDGKDGLRVGDIPDLVVKGDEITWTEVPARIVVRPALSKTRQPYFTFLGPEGVAHVEAYLRARMQRGERMTARSVIVSGTKNVGSGQTKYLDGEKAITSSNISDGIRAAMRAANLNERPYIWRSFFAATADRCRDLPEAWREFYMGHVSDVAK